MLFWPFDIVRSRKNQLLDRTAYGIRPSEEHLEISAIHRICKVSGTAELCRKHSISAQTFYRQKAKFGGVNVSEAQRLRQLEGENRKLKQMALTSRYFPVPGLPEPPQVFASLS